MRYIALSERLALMARVSLDELCRELFAAGAVDVKSAEELLRSDFKEFHISEQVLGVGQITCAAGVVTLLIGLVATVFCRPLLGLFSSDPAVLDAAVRYTWWVLPFIWTYAVFNCMMSFVNGTGSAAALQGFCAGIQSCSPVDSFVSPEPADEPGYTDQVIMASGSFTEGSTIEISCDGPLRAPYTCYLQGGVNFTAGRAAVLNAVQKAFFA